MAFYLIAFNDEWVPQLTLDDLKKRGVAGRAVLARMKDAGIFVFSDGALGAETALGSVDPSSGSPVFTPGLFVERDEHLGGLAIIEVDDDEQARFWAQEVAMAVGWPQELHRFPPSR